MRVRPTHRELYHPVQVAERHITAHLYTTPNRGPDIADRNFELVYNGSFFAGGHAMSKGKELYHLPNPLPRFCFFAAFVWLARAENPRWS